MFKKIQEQKDFENFLYETNIPIKLEQQWIQSIEPELNYAKKILRHFMPEETEIINKIDKRIEELVERHKSLQVCRAGTKKDGKWIPVYKGDE